jgi:hypothetical protein
VPSFVFTVPAAPPSVNASYRIVRVPHKGGGSHQQLAKTEDAWAFQTYVAHLCNKARPSDFAPVGQIRVRLGFFLKRAADPDNLLKVTLDGVKFGLGTKEGRGGKPIPLYDDKLYLPCVLSNEDGHKEPRVEVQIEYDQD